MFNHTEAALAFMGSLQQLLPNTKIENASSGKVNEPDFKMENWAIQLPYKVVTLTRQVNKVPQTRLQLTDFSDTMRKCCSSFIWRTCTSLVTCVCFTANLELTCSRHNRCIQGGFAAKRPAGTKVIDTWLVRAGFIGTINLLSHVWFESHVAILPCERTKCLLYLRFLSAA